jgi:hypothetical protein
MLNNMNIKNLEFGNIEGKEEFNNNNIEDLYLDIFKVENVIKDKKYYIYGNKGTGKTSLLRYLKYKLEKQNKNTVIILFKDIKQNISIYSKFKKLISESNDIDMATKAFWQWFLLSLAVKENNLNFNENNLIFNANSGFFKKISYTLLSIIKGLKASYNHNNNLNIELDGNKIKSDEDISSLEEAGDKIEYLKKIIKEELDNDFYILIDELETSEISSTHKEDTILIKNLINSINFLNNINKKLNLIVAVRTEIINNVYSTGDEINKLLESKGIEIKWFYDNYNVNHPLIKMIIKKMRTSMINFSKENEKLIRKTPDEDIFKRWFPEQLLKENKRGDNSKILLNNTWLKPRDLVRFMNMLKKKAENDNFFKRKHYDEAVKEYSQKAWTEIKEELSASLNAEILKGIEQSLSNFKNKFTYNELYIRLQKYINNNNIADIIELLYKIGVIGNNYKKDNGSFVFKYYYRGDKYLDQDKEIEIHRALWKAFSLQSINRRSNNNYFNDSLKTQLHNIIN